MSSKAIGIDLGTTFSCVAAIIEDEVVIIPNEHNEKLTPSCVYFEDDGGIIVGKYALEKKTRKPGKVVYDVKRLIGRKYHEVDPDDMKRWHFKVINENSNPMVIVDDKKYNPEQISAMVLNKMRETAEAYLGAKVKDAVITVPAYFNQSQKQATIDAGKIAGLNVLQLLVEPTAAALAYGIQHQSSVQRNVLVYDLGGGTFDVSIVSILNKEVHVLSSEGDPHLGGEDFDNIIVDHVVAKFRLNHDANPRKDRHAMGRLKNASEAAKRLLSGHETAQLEIDSFIGDTALDVSLTRLEFEEQIESHITSTIKMVEAAVSLSELSNEEIDDLVLVGGSSRIPLVQNALSEYFDGRQLRKNVHPDEAVAFGAAAMAGQLTGNEVLIGVIASDVTPLSLGTDVLENGIRGCMSVIIPKNTRIPHTGVARLETTVDNQTISRAGVYEGEHPMVASNHVLGEVTLTNLPLGPAGTVQFEYTFTIDTNGILKCTYIETSTRNTESINISYNTGRLSEDEIARMILQAESYRRREELKKRIGEAKSALVWYCIELKKSAKEGRVAGHSGIKVIAACIETMDWIDMSDATNTEEEYMSKLNEMENLFGKIELV